jgi:hypothetical protein
MGAAVAVGAFFLLMPDWFSSPADSFRKCLIIRVLRRSNRLHHNGFDKPAEGKFAAGYAQDEFEIPLSLTAQTPIVIEYRKI